MFLLGLISCGVLVWGLYKIFFDPSLDDEEESETDTQSTSNDDETQSGETLTIDNYSCLSKSCESDSSEEESEEVPVVLESVSQLKSVLSKRRASLPLNP